MGGVSPRAVRRLTGARGPRHGLKVAGPPQVVSGAGHAVHAWIGDRPSVATVPFRRRHVGSAPWRSVPDRDLMLRLHRPWPDGLTPAASGGNALRWPYGRGQDRRRHGCGGLRTRAALRGRGLRSSLVRLLGGRGPRLEGGPAELADRRGWRGREAGLRRGSTAQPLRGRGRRTAREPVRRGARGWRPGTEPVPPRRRTAHRQSVRPAPAGPPDGGSATRRASSGCSVAGSASSGATPRSSSSTIARSPTRSSARSPRTRGRSACASSMHSSRTRRSPP